MNYESILEINPVLLALFAALFTWGLTALGASMVFFFKKIDPKVLNSILGFAAGVMIAASFLSLLGPAARSDLQSIKFYRTSTSGKKWIMQKE